MAEHAESLLFIKINYSQFGMIGQLKILRTTYLTSDCLLNNSTVYSWIHDCMEFNYNTIRGIGTGPATAGPKFSEPTIKILYHYFVMKQLETFILQLNVYAIY